MQNQDLQMVLQIQHVLIDICLDSMQRLIASLDIGLALNLLLLSHKFQKSIFHLQT